MLFSDGHPHHYNTSLYYLKMRRGRFFRADGRLVGSLADLPFHFADLDPVSRFRVTHQRAWPQDIATDTSGAPVAVFTRTVGRTDWFHYARWNGRRWEDHAVVSAGHGGGTRGFHTGGMPGYYNNGITVDHSDPSWVVLARRMGQTRRRGRTPAEDEWNQVELRHTEDGGRTWTATTLTSGRSGFSIRPIFPRGLHLAGRFVVAYVAGTAHTFRDFHTRVRIVSARWPTAQTPTDGGSSRR
jgi:hypothetical protein